MRKWAVLKDLAGASINQASPSPQDTSIQPWPYPENEGTISGTYSVIDTVFTEQLGYDHAEDVDGQLHLVHGNQKTVTLICTVQKE